MRLFTYSQGINCVLKIHIKSRLVVREVCSSYLAQSNNMVCSAMPDGRPRSIQIAVHPIHFTKVMPVAWSLGEMSVMPFTEVWSQPFARFVFPGRDWWFSLKERP